MREYVVSPLARLRVVDVMQPARDGEGSNLAAMQAPRAVTHPDELLEQAVATMIRHRVGRLPVVARDETGRRVGYLGRAEIAAALRALLEEEQLPEAGWLSPGMQRFGRRLVRVLAGAGRTRPRTPPPGGAGQAPAGQGPP